MADGELIFPVKRLVYHKKEIQGDIEEAVKEFKAKLEQRSLSVKNDKVFLPNMSEITGDKINKLVVNSGTARSGLTVYRINAPGFFYYQHWRGNWDPSGWMQILVCKDSDFNSSYPVYEYLNTRDSAYGKNEHNNMIPINPGSKTYVVILGSLSEKTNTKQLYFIPAWGYTASEAISKVKSTTNLTDDVVSGNPNDDEFIAIFS